MCEQEVTLYKSDVRVRQRKGREALTTASLMQVIGVSIDISPLLEGHDLDKRGKSLLESSLCQSLLPWLTWLLRSDLPTSSPLRRPPPRLVVPP